MGDFLWPRPWGDVKGCSPLWKEEMQDAWSHGSCSQGAKTNQHWSSAYILLSPFLFGGRPQPVEWHHQHPRWTFHLQSHLSGNALTDIPSWVCPCLPERISSVDSQGKASLNRSEIPGSGTWETWEDVFLPVIVACAGSGFHQAGLLASVLRPPLPLHLSSWMLHWEELQQTWCFIWNSVEVSSKNQATNWKEQTLNKHNSTLGEFKHIY